ncbi:TPA: type IV secretory system conjugative DNA transfer family protein [Streptococcus equi subsp. zooepidemicus]|uniref:VirD4-like conjugal transfer protein, CD1115 family n=1 Tax=Streptococcus equi TaxID=1336 RepID=UPI0005B9EE78|nr:type IV secretory system conjugative DNA transfer family protein [Streptococcus equi]KIS05314.1 Type IV secretory pathway, VirD4 component [Streptococcus equi subsp. zooepidemicus Sz12is]MCD3460463.1 type IV secretory system conjugative DNA transfer family protein [Streptococcus equi subsp. zooepidemicus]HEK9980026.1 type IV secretory system conjugative DNA transfer family protein [Streptococcus equi subsp. zooepidemicus]HEL0119976.1 type IV secretory system conjugative DNA transfer family p
MVSGKKAISFVVLGLAFGYFCHRLVLLYDSLSNQPPLERFAYLLGEGQNQVLNPLWNGNFTGRSVVGFCFGLVTMGLVYLYVSTGQKVYREGAEYGSARFGNSRECKAFLSKNPLNDTILSRNVRLTLLEKKPPPFDRNKNLVVIGGSGAGKTFRFVKPNLIQLNCSNIVVDPKDHLAEKTGKLFLENGYQVKVLDLVNMTNSDGFNPFRYVETENDLNRMLTVYFNNTKGNGSRSDPFWDEASMTLVRAISSYLVDFYNPPGITKEEADSRRKRGRYPAFSEIGKLIKLLSKGDNQDKSVLEVMFENYAKKYGTENFTMRNWADFQNYKDKTLDSVIAVTTAKFALFNIQSVIDLTKRDTLDLKTWGTQKTMVYLVIPDNDTTFRFLSALFFSTVFSTLTRQADVDFKGQLPIHVRSYLDEFANCGEIPDFAEQTSTVRSRNMSLVPILQNIAQLQGLYKEKDAWKTILGNCDSLLYLGGNDEETFKFMSGLLGKQTIDVRSTSRSYGQTGSGSTSHQKIARDLMTLDEVGNMKRDECLVRIAGVPVFKEKKYFPLKHKNWSYLADKESDERWWHYHIDPLETQEPPFEPSDHKVRDLSTETTLH